MVDVTCISTSWRKEHTELATSSIVLLGNNHPHDWKKNQVVVITNAPM